MNRSAIFVSIASYRDPELIPTLKDMIATAAHPKNLHIVVCWQDDGDLTPFHVAGFYKQEHPQAAEQDIAEFKLRGARITLLCRHYYQSKGACWARHLAETRFGDEDYFLQIDSHCRFIPQWDVKMITLLSSLLSQSPRPLLSAYPPGYQPGEDEQRQNFVNRMIFREFTREGIPMAGSKNFRATQPQRGSYLAGGFIFTLGRFVRDVPNDPHIFFAGEEIAMSVRAFTHGYDVYHPHQPLLWHYYQRADSPKIWQDHDNSARDRGAISESWWQRDQRSKRRITTLLGINQDNPEALEPYGCGTLRTVREFEYQCGLLFSQQAVQPAVADERKQAFFPEKVTSEQQWLDSFAAHYDRQITLPLALWQGMDSPYDHLHLTVYDTDNHLLYRDHLCAGVSARSTDGVSVCVVISFSTPTPCFPATIRVCGWHKNQGWGPLTEYPW